MAGPASLQAQQDFPSKPITIIVPFGPGGLIDVGTRIFAEGLSKELKVPIVIENKAGGAGIIGASAMYNAPPDGYTLLAASGAAVISSVQLAQTPPFDTRKDFLPIGYLADAPSAMSVAKNAPFKTFDEFLKYARANPGKLRGGAPSLGGETHIMFEMIRKEAKIDSKLIPYKDTGSLVTAIMGGHLDWMCLSGPATMPYHKSGDVKIVLLTSKSSELPGIPSGPDVGLPGVSVDMWISLFAHGKIPQPAYDKLVTAVAATAKHPDLAKKLSAAGITMNYKAPADFRKLIDKEWGVFGDVIKEAGLKK